MLFIFAGGIWFYQTQKLLVRRSAEANIEAIAKFKAHQIIEWRTERLADADVLMDSPIWHRSRQQLRLTPFETNDPLLLTYFDSLKKNYDFHDVLLTDAQGEILLSLSGKTGQIHSEIWTDIQMAFLQQRPMLTDLRLNSGCNSPHSQLIAPLLRPDEFGAQPIGAVVFEIDANQFLYPVTQSWPTPSRSGEVLFVRRDGDNILYLNELRFQHGTAMKLRIPLARTNVPAVMAANGQRGVFIGFDYRNVEVLAAVQPIPESPWFMVAKIDTSEAFADWKARGKLIIAAIAMLMMVMSSAIGIVWLQYGKYLIVEELAQTLSRTGEERRDRERLLAESEEQFRKLFEDSAEATLLIEEDRFIDCNRAALESLRMTSRSQICGLHPSQISPKVQSDGMSSKEKVGKVIALALKNSSHTFEWEHLRADGEVFLADVVLTSIQHRGRQLLHVVWRDITERRQIENSLKDALALNQELINAATVGIVVFDATGACVIANEAAARATGAKREQLLAGNFRQLASWKRSGLLKAAERVLASGEPERIEIDILTSFKREAVLDCSLSCFESGGRLHLLLAFSDVTDRRRAEALRSQLSAIMELTSDFVAMASPEMKITYLNRTARRMFGLGDNDSPSLHSIEKSHPAWAARLVLEEGIPSAIRNGVWQGETAFLDHAGTEILHTQVITAHKNPSGELTMISTVARDISERKRNEDILKARIRLLQAASGTTLDKYLQSALDEIEAQTGSCIGFFHFVDTDQETLTLQAWSSNTILRMCAAQGKGSHYPVSQAGVWCDCIRTRAPVIQNDYASLTHKKGLPDRHAAIVRELVFPILRNDQIVAVVGVGNKSIDYVQADVDVAILLGDFSWEIIERKRTENALASSEQRLRLAAETAEIGIWDWDLATNTVSWDRQMFRLYGLEPTANMIVPYQAWADAVLPEDLPEQERILREMARDGGHSARDFRIRRATDGLVRHLHAAEISLVDSGGHPVRVVGANLDMTQRQKLLAELSRSNTDLEQFAYVASHDLKSPLRAIDSLAGWLQEDLETVLKGENRKHLQLLRQRVGRMEQLLDDLLTYSRAGRVASDIILINVADLVAEITEFLSPPTAFSVHLQSAAPSFFTAVTPLRQVLTNLISNAIKHHDRNQGRVEISVEDEGDWMIFSVADDGPGIAPKFHEHIFGMFQTLRPRDEVEGSGIGLAVVRRIITHYGGRITVECRQPRGTLFRFNWPKTILERIL